MSEEQKNIKVRLRHIIIIILIILNLFINYGFWSVTNSYELLMGFIMITWPSTGLLFISSRASQSKDVKWQKKISWSGMAVALVLFVLVGLSTWYRLARYYLGF